MDAAARLQAASSRGPHPAVGGPRLARLDQETLGMRDEQPPCPDALVHPGQLIPVSVDGESGDGPRNLAKEVDDCAHVVELHPECLFPQIDHGEARGPRPGNSPLRAPCPAHRLRPHHEIGQLPVGAGPDLLRKIRSAGAQDAGDLRPDRDRGMPAHDQVERRLAERQAGFVVRRYHRRAERVQVPLRCSDVRRP